MLGASAGRATGRPPPSGLAAPARELLLGRDAGFDATFRVEPPGRVRELLLAVARLAGAFFLPPEREVVERFAVLRLAVDFLAVDLLAVDFLAVDLLAVDLLAVDFFVDFFFAAIDPPFGCAMRNRAR